MLIFQDHTGSSAISETLMFDVEGFILVGGASSRMGTNKALLDFDGLSAIERIAAELGSIASRVRLVGAPESLSHVALENVPDLHARWGALGGIHAALSACASDWAIIVACDLPLVTRKLFECLVALSGGHFDAIVPRQPDGKVQPLCAAYRRSTCLAQTEELIKAGDHMPRAMLDKVRTRWLKSNELAELPGAQHFFLNVNTPADYQRARAILALRRSPN